MIKTSVISIIALILGFLCGRLFQKQPTQILSKTETHTEIAQKQEVQVQATTQKDSTTGLKTSYVEKTFNNKGILIHQINYGSQIDASSSDHTNDRHTIAIDKNETSDIQSTTIKSYASNLYFGLNVPTIDFKNPNNIVSKPEEINFMLEYRPFERVNFFIESNYKFETQIGFLISL